MKFILGRKLGMSQVFDDDGKVVPVTIIEAEQNIVTQVKTNEKDGYGAVQLGFGTKRRVSKPVAGHLKKAGAGSVRWLREFRLENQKFYPERSRGAKITHSTGSGQENQKPEDVEYRLGQKIDVSVFQEGDVVKVSGVSKGKGFQGVVKRHGFHGASATHGTKHAHRQPGSIGATTPQRVWKGKKMAGRMGHERVTVRNVKIVKVDKEKGWLAVKGAVPGARGTLLEIRG